MTNEAWEAELADVQRVLAHRLDAPLGRTDIAELQVRALQVRATLLVAQAFWKVATRPGPAEALAALITKSLPPGVSPADDNRLTCPCDNCEAWRRDQVPQ